MGNRHLLRTAIGRTAEVRPIWAGLKQTDRIELDLVDVNPLPPAFRRMVRDLEFDLCEIPIVTLAQAVERGVPITGIPLPVSRRFHHTSILCPVGSAIRGPADLIGQRIAVRSFPQTSGVWVRGILAHDHGVAPERTTWVLQEGAHVLDYTAPSWVHMDTTGRSLLQMVTSGDVAAVAGLHGIPDGLRPVIPDADRAAGNWFARTGIFPINHVLAVRTALLDDAPWLLDEICALFTQALNQALDDGSADATIAAIVPGQRLHTHDHRANRASMQMLLDFALEQDLLRQPWRIPDLFDHFDWA